MQIASDSIRLRRAAVYFSLLATPRLRAAGGLYHCLSYISVPVSTGQSAVQQILETGADLSGSDSSEDKSAVEGRKERGYIDIV